MRQSDTVRKASTTVTSYIRRMEEATIQSADEKMSMADGVYKMLPITVDNLPDWKMCNVQDRDENTTWAGSKSSGLVVECIWKRRQQHLGCAGERR